MEMDKYLDMVSAQIRDNRARAMAVKELRDHMEDQAAACEAEGMTREEAVREAARQMGDPVTAGVELDRIHRPKMEWRLFFWILAFSILGLFLQYVCFYGIGQAGGNTMEYFVRQCWYTLSGIGIMAAVCLWDYSILGKHPELSGTCFLGIIGISGVSGILPMMNGGYPYLKCLMYLFVPLYAGILYSNRGKGYLGMGISTVWIGVAFGVAAGIIGGGISVTGDALAVCTVMFFAAVGGEWFGVPRKKGFAAAGCVFAAAAVLMIANLKGYQIARLQAFFHPEDFAQTAGYHISQIRKIASCLSFNQNSYQILEQKGLLDFWNHASIQNQYMILQSAVVLGLAKTIGVCGLYGLFFLYLFFMAAREKNRLGRMAAFGCTLLLALETVRNVMYNFGLDLSSTAGIPFFSYGRLHTLTVYGLLGILLSIYRHRNLVWDIPAVRRGTDGGIKIGNYVIRVEKEEKLSSGTAGQVTKV
ncbi:MAG: FtsW/RodA/SpoVE family cell cycle protein [Hungatella sp.]|nr:FtsW/RodA/SpoVE family cell cycle protein [Hungatella sp.]